MGDAVRALLPLVATCAPAGGWEPGGAGAGATTGGCASSGIEP